jgi:hypothetical protein
MQLENALIPATIRQAVEQLRDALRHSFAHRLREVVLFGSYARGEADEDSDVDVLVVVDDLTERERLAVFEIAHQTDARRADAWVGLSVVAHSTAQSERMRARRRPLYDAVDHEGVRA